MTSNRKVHSEMLSKGDKSNLLILLSSEFNKKQTSLNSIKTNLPEFNTKTSCSTSRQTGFMGIVRSKDNNIGKERLEDHSISVAWSGKGE